MQLCKYLYLNVALLEKHMSIFVCAFYMCVQSTQISLKPVTLTLVINTGTLMLA